MLKAMRDSFQHLKWILLLIVFAFILLVFVDWGGAGRAGAVTGVGYAAKVNGETITIEEFQRSLVMLEQQYEQVYGQRLSQQDREAMGLQRQVLQSLVNQKLLLQAAHEMNLTATPEEIRHEILSMPVLSPNGQFVGQELYERYVKAALNYQSAAAFEADLAEDITLSKIENALQSSVVLPDKLIEQEYRRRNELATIRYVLLPAQTLMTQVEVEPDGIDQYYRSNASDYTHPAQRRVKYLQVDVEALRPSIQVTEEELREAYEQESAGNEVARAQHILISIPQTATPDDVTAALEKAQDIAARARAGEDFAALAREFSDDPGSASRGGDLGEFGRGRMVPEFEEAVFSQPIGQVGDPVRTQFGYHVIKVNERRTKTFEELRSELREQVLSKKVQQEALDQLRSVEARLPKEGVTEEQMRAMQNEFLRYNETGWFGQSDPITGLGRLPQLNSWAFSADVRDIGPVIESQFLTGPILPHLVGTREAGITPLAEIRNRVQDDLRREKARGLAAEQLEAAKGSSLDQIAEAKGLEVKEATVRPTAPVTGLTGRTAELTRAVFETDEGAFGGPVEVGEGAVVFEVTEITRFDRAAFEAEKATLAQDLRLQESRKLRAALLDKMRQAAEISINQDMLPQSQRSL